MSAFLGDLAMARTWAASQLFSFKRKSKAICRILKVRDMKPAKSTLPIKNREELPFPIGEKTRAICLD